MITRDWPILGALLLIALSLFLNFVTTPLECAHQPLDQANCETFFARTITDPVSFYTLWLAAFTIVLAVASIYQGRLTKQSIDLAREEFISTHRPRMILREAFTATFLEGEKIGVFFRIANVGETAGTIVLSDIKTEIVRKDSYRLLLHSSINTQNELGALTLGPGEERLLRVSPELCPAWTKDIFEMRDGTRIAVIHLVGQLVYADVFGNVRRRTAFRRELTPETQRFYRVRDEPDLDYAD